VTEDFAPQTSVPRCSKCRRPAIEYTECYEHYVSFDIVDGKRATEGYLHEGPITGVRARCECGHRWRTRMIHAAIRDQPRKPHRPDGGT
jgi:hypothetical protein